MADKAHWGQMSTLLALCFVGFAACGGGTVTDSPNASTPDEGIPTSAQTLPPPVTVDLEALAPRRVEFQSGDGTVLVGTYWPPTLSPAPGVILMHMMGGSKEDWLTFAALLQGAALARVGAGEQRARSYAVLAIDFRGHGESGGNPDPNLMNQDARSALAYIQTLPEVDPAAIIMIGASVGADAAVDECGQGCIGAVSLSPGGYLGVAYNDALAALGSKPVLCVASEGDTVSADTCRGGDEVGLPDYQTHLYSGNAHGTDIFNNGQQPYLTDLVFEWLSSHVP